MMKKLLRILVVLAVASLIMPAGIAKADDTGYIELWFYLQYGLREGDVEFTVLNEETQGIVGSYHITLEEYLDVAYRIELPEGRYRICDMKMEGVKSDKYTYEIYGADHTAGTDVYVGQSSYIEAWIGAPWLGDSFITEEVMRQYGYERYPVEFWLKGCTYIDRNILVYVNDDKGTSYELIFQGGDATKGLVKKSLPEGKYTITDIFVEGAYNDYTFDSGIGRTFTVSANQETPDIAKISCATKFGKFYYCMTAEVVDESGNLVSAPETTITYLDAKDNEL